MSNTHTPGPWFSSLRSDGGIGPKSKDEDQSFGIVIPVAYIEAFDWPDSFTHNSRLIAAAPDLLEELENCLDLLATCFFEAPIDSCMGVAITKARAAIAKAVG